MFRRNFLSALANLPLLGFLKPLPAAAGSEVSRGEQLELVVSNIKRLPRIRVWKLGDLEKKILPKEEALQRLADILRNWDGQSDLDLVWDATLTVQEFAVLPEDVDCLIDGFAPKITIRREEK